MLIHPSFLQAGTVPTKDLLLWFDPTTDTYRTTDAASLQHVLDRATINTDNAGAKINNYVLLNGAAFTILDGAMTCNCDGVDDYIGGDAVDTYVIDEPVTLDLEEDFSWIVWVNFTEANVGASNYVDLIGQGDSALSGQSMSIMSDSEDNRSIQILGPSGDLTKTELGVSEGWNSIAYCKSNESKNVYFNAEYLTGYEPVSGSGFEPTDDNSDVEIGRIKNGTFKYRGVSKKFGPVLVYQKELSQSEVQQAHGAIRNRIRD
tara:strand:- start:10881 stop:11663 length:783 start_codon:yes stop_codon:yes gene_type:complete